MIGHSYAFRSAEKVQLQEIGPRFTLKLRSLRKGLPAVKNLGEVSKDLEFDTFEEEDKEEQNNDTKPISNKGGAQEGGNDGMDAPTEDSAPQQEQPKQVVPPKQDEYVWMWKASVISPSTIFLLAYHRTEQPELETTRRTFFL